MEHKIVVEFVHMERTIGIFCSANELEEKYTKPALEFARLMAKNGYNLVWGGTDQGLMNLVASEVQNNGGKIIGVSVEHLKHLARKNVDEMIITKSPGERKATYLKRSNAIIVLVGGIGTFDEVTDVLENKKHGLLDIPVVVLNTDNFYEGFRNQLQRMQDDGFLIKPFEEMIHFANTPQEAMDVINKSLGEPEPSSMA